MESMTAWRPRRPAVWAFGLYLLLSLALMGWRMLPDPAVACACQGTDPATYVWSLAWWPHALVNGLNPFVVHSVWYPYGANLARFATIPSVSLALWPVTAIFGPQVSYNLVSLASPALAAFSAYLLCRRICGRQLPALIGGYLFGFGAYQFPQLVGHPNLSLVFLIPLMVLLALKRVEREMSARAYLLGLGALIVVQVGISTEVLTTAVVLGFLLLLCSRVLAPEPYRGRIGGLMLETVGAGLIAALVTSPFLYYALVKGGAPQEMPMVSDTYGLDLLNPVMPTISTWLGGSALHGLTVKFEHGDFAEANGYLSLPIIAALIIWVLSTRRRTLARLVLIAFLASLVAALGSHLHVAGNQGIVLPYQLIRGLPLVNLVTPSRLVMYASLAAAVGVSAWLAEATPGSRGRLARWLVVGLGCVMVFPAPTGETWTAPPVTPAFFRTAIHRRYLRPGQVLLALPYGPYGTSMGWQAACGFCFRMPEGYLGHFGPPQITGRQAVRELLHEGYAVAPANLARFLTSYDIHDIVLQASTAELFPYAAELEELGLHPLRVGGVLLFHVDSPALLGRSGG